MLIDMQEFVRTRVGIYSNTQETVSMHGRTVLLLHGLSCCSCPGSRPHASPMRAIADRLMCTQQLQRKLPIEVCRARHGCRFTCPAVRSATSPSSESDTVRAQGLLHCSAPDQSYCWAQLVISTHAHDVCEQISKSTQYLGCKCFALPSVKRESVCVYVQLWKTASV